MYGIEPIAGQLHGAAVIPLTAPVQPNKYQRAQGEALLRYFKGQSQYAHGVNQPGQQNAVNHKNSGGLSGKLPPSASAEKIKDKNSKHAGAVVVYHGDGAEQPAQGDAYCGRRRKNPGLLRLPRSVQNAEEGKGQQKGPYYVLMEGINYRAAGHQIEWNFGQYCKNQQPDGVLPAAFCVVEALNQHKCKDRVGHPSYTGHPGRVAGNNGCPHMVAQHECHRRNMKREGAELRCLLEVHK